MKKAGRGGRGRNQGLRPGTYKNAEKAPEQRHSVKQQVTYTPDEYEQAKAAMAAAGIEKHTDFARIAAIKYAAEILTKKQDG